MPFYIFINSIKVINFWNLCENILGFTRKATTTLDRKKMRLMRRRRKKTQHTERDKPAAAYSGSAGLSVL